MIIRSKENTAEDPTVPTRPGWEGMHCWWLLSQESSGTTGVVACISEFAPGVAHGLHRHSNARENLYLEHGSGLAFNETEIRRVGAGEMITFAPDEWHAFINDRQETVRLIAFYSHDTYDDLAYEDHPDWRPVYERLNVANPDI